MDLPSVYLTLFLLVSGSFMYLSISPFILLFLLQFLSHPFGYPSVCPSAYQILLAPTVGQLLHFLLYIYIWTRWLIFILLYFLHPASFL